MSAHIMFLSAAHPPLDKRVFAKEAVSLAAAGYRVTHLCPYPGEGPGAWCAEGVAIETYAKPRGILARALAIPALALRARRSAADVLHCNEVDSWLAGLLAKLTLVGRVRVVFDVHEHYPSTFAESRFAPALRPLVAASLRLLFRALTPLTDRIVFAKASVAPDFPGAGAKGVLVQNFAPRAGLLGVAASPPPASASPSPAERGRVGEGVAPHSQRPSRGTAPSPTLPRSAGEGEAREGEGEAEAGEGERQVTLIHVGLISRLRGWPQLLAAMARLGDEYRLHVIGTFNDGSQAEFHAEAARLRLAGRIRHDAWMNFADMLAACRAADIGLVLFQPGTQNHVFASPHKLFDYWLAGLPVIAPDFAIEVAAFMRDAAGGVLVDPADPAAIADAIAGLDAAARRRMGQAGRAAVLERFNWESEAAKLLSMYAELLPHPTPARESVPA